MAAVVIVAVGTLAYADSLSGPFVFDGTADIEQNPAIRRLWPPWAPMIDSVRLFAIWSFAVNYALGGAKPWGYHAVNLAVHLTAALVLFGIVRRSLSGRRLAARFAGAAWGLALAVAVLWLVHPLQTQSVTYIYQRYESLMGLFVMLTLYCFIRSQDSSAPNLWYLASMACCLLAVTSKEVAAVAPLLVLWYDRAFATSSWREIFRRRWAYYAALAGTWVILAGLMLSQADKFSRAGVLVVENLTPWQYAASQPGVIAHYLRLALWPADLCLDYGWPVAQTAGMILPPLLLIVALLALTAWAIFRWPEWSFVGAWFFLILAPTSSVFPIRDLAFEHRMYLPLAAVVTGVVLCVWVAGLWLVRRRMISLPVLQVMGGALVLLAVAALGLLTFQRNLDYQSDLLIWADTSAKAPHNERAHYNLGRALAGCQREDEAIVHYRKALELNPDYVNACNNLAATLAGRGQFDEAVAEYRKSLKIKPDDAGVYYNLGNMFVQTGRFDEAIIQYQKALKNKANSAEIHNNFGGALAARGQVDEAIAHYQKALELQPDFADARINLGVAQSKREGILKLLAGRRESLRSRPKDVALLNDTAWLLATNPNASIRNGAEAVELAQRAAQLSGGQEPAVLGTLAAAFAEAGRFPETLETARKALDLAQQQNNQSLAESIKAKIPLYEAGTPFRQIAQPARSGSSKP